MADKHLLTNLSYATLLSLDIGKSTGSGFLLNHKEEDYLITARHVLYDEEKLRCDTLQLISSQNSRETIDDSKIIEIDINKATILDGKTDDIAIIPIGSIEKMNMKDYVAIVQEGKSKTLSVSSEITRKLSEIGVANEVYLIGFPTSLIFQNSKHFDVGKPLLRKGIIAGINTEDNTFIIDCSAYYGNSGAPIIEVCEDETLKIAGVVSRYIPFVIEWRNNRETNVSHAEYLNSGYSVCVPMDAVFKLIN